MAIPVSELFNTLSIQSISTWIRGNGVPLSGTGNNGNWYYDIDTGSVYYKELGSWNEQLLGGGGGASLSATPWNITLSPTLPVDAAPGVMYQIEGSGSFENASGNFVHFLNGDIAMVLLDGVSVGNLTKNAASTTIVGYTTWDPASVSPGVTLSNGNLQATGPSQGLASSDVSISTTDGNLIFELTAAIPFQPGYAIGGGFVNYTADTTNLASLPLMTGVLMLITSGGIQCLAFDVGTVTPITVTNPPVSYSSGDVLTFLYNSATREMQCKYNGVLLTTNIPIIVPDTMNVKAALYTTPLTTVANFGATPFNHPEVGYVGIGFSQTNYQGPLYVVSTDWNPSNGYPAPANLSAGDLYYSSSSGTISGKFFPSGSGVWYDGGGWRTMDEYVPDMGALIWIGEYPGEDTNTNTLPPYVENGVFKATTNLKWREDTNPASTDMYNVAPKGALLIGRNNKWTILTTSRDIYNNGEAWGSQPYISTLPTYMSDYKLVTTTNKPGVFEFNMGAQSFDPSVVTGVVGIYLAANADASLFYTTETSPEKLTIDFVNKTITAFAGGVNIGSTSYVGDNASGDVFSIYLYYDYFTLGMKVYRNGALLGTFSGFQTASNYVYGYVPYAEMTQSFGGSPYSVSEESMKSMIQYTTGRVPFKYLPAQAFQRFTFDQYTIEKTVLKPGLLAIHEESMAQIALPVQFDSNGYLPIGSGGDFGSGTISSHNQGTLTLNGSFWAYPGTTALGVTRATTTYEDAFSSDFYQYVRNSNLFSALTSTTLSAYGGGVVIAAMGDVWELAKRAALVGEKDIINSLSLPVSSGEGVDGQYAWQFGSVAVDGTVSSDGSKILIGPKRFGEWREKLTFPLIYGSTEYINGNTVSSDQKTYNVVSTSWYNEVISPVRIPWTAIANNYAKGTVGFKINSIDNMDTISFGLQVPGISSLLSVNRNLSTGSTQIYHAAGSGSPSSVAETPFIVAYTPGEEWLFSVSGTELILTDPLGVQHVYANDWYLSDIGEEYAFRVAAPVCNGQFTLLHASETTLTKPTGYEQDIMKRPAIVGDFTTAIPGVAVGMGEDGTSMWLIDSAGVKTPLTKALGTETEVGSYISVKAPKNAFETRYLQILSLDGNNYVTQTDNPSIYQWSVPAYNDGPLYVGSYTFAERSAPAIDTEYVIVQVDTSVAPANSVIAGEPLEIAIDKPAGNLHTKGDGIIVSEDGWYRGQIDARTGDLLICGEGTDAYHIPLHLSSNVVDIVNLEQEQGTTTYEVYRPYKQLDIIARSMAAGPDVELKIKANSLRPNGATYRVYNRTNTRNVVVKLANADSGSPYVSVDNSEEMLYYPPNTAPVSGYYTYNLEPGEHIELTKTSGYEAGYEYWSVRIPVQQKKQLYSVNITRLQQITSDNDNTWIEYDVTDQLRDATDLHLSGVRASAILYNGIPTVRSFEVEVWIKKDGVDDRKLFDLEPTLIPSVAQWMTVEMFDTPKFAALKMFGNHDAAIRSVVIKCRANSLIVGESVYVQTELFGYLSYGQTSII